MSIATGIPVSEFVGGAQTNDYLSKYGIKVIRLRELNISEALKLITEKYNIAKIKESFKGGNSIRELFDECRRILNNSDVLKKYPNIKVVSSYGKGNWATIPWISFLDIRETNTTQDGTYIVILFCEKGTGCYIKMAQGVTQPTKKYGIKAVDILHEKAAKIRANYLYLQDNGFDLSGKSDLGSEKKLAKLYEASTVASKFYDVHNFPSEEQIFNDLANLLECYDDYVRLRDQETPPAKDSRDLVLLGTWREVTSEYAKVKKAIEDNGAWAFWWSFRINPAAERILTKPFYLYINVGNGEIPVRIKISDWQSSSNNEGIITPWPDETPSEWQNKNNIGAKQSEKFITWAKAIEIEKLEHTLSKEDFDPAPGLSTKENLLNQMVFGYAYVDPDPEPEIGPITSNTVEGIIATAHNDFTKANLRLQESTVLRYVASLLTKRFVIISGLSGSGKTMLAHAFATWMSQAPAQYKVVAVGSDWTSNENILGYQDALQPSIYRKPTNGALDLILRASRDKLRPYFLILDEMNLSHVERYFADILSSIETGEAIALHSALTNLNINESLPIPPTLVLPNNLFFIGTVNIDETTYMFSPKVLDRANVVEFRATAEEISDFLDSPAQVNMDDLAGQGAEFGFALVRAAHSNVSLTQLLPGIGDGIAASFELKQRLTELFTELSLVGAEFGFRTAFEVSRFFYHHAVLSGDDWQFKDALDAQIVQKLMPKLHGSDRKLRKVLVKLKTFCEIHDLKLSLAKTDRMLERLAQDGFTSFAEA